MLNNLRFCHQVFSQVLNKQLQDIVVLLNYSGKFRVLCFLFPLYKWHSILNQLWRDLKRTLCLFES